MSAEGALALSAVVTLDCGAPVVTVDDGGAGAAIVDGAWVAGETEDVEVVGADAA
jgi:hypothetical protein